MRTTTSEFLAMDEKIDKLSDEAIKDIWVRQNMFKKRRDELRTKAEVRGENPYMTDEMDQLEADCTVGDHDGNLYNQFDEMLTVQARNEMRESEKSPEMWLFDSLTKDDIDEETAIEMARNKLKAACEGCGMPHINVIRNSVRSYAKLEREDDTR